MNKEEEKKDMNFEHKDLGVYVSNSEFKQIWTKIKEETKGILELFDFKNEPIFLFGSLVTFSVHSVLYKEKSAHLLQFRDIDIGLDILNPDSYFDHVESMFQRFRKKFPNAEKTWKVDGVIRLTSPDSEFSIDLVWLYANFRMENGFLSRETFTLQGDLSCSQWYCDQKHVFGSHAAFDTLRTGFVTVCTPVVRPSRLEKAMKRGFTINPKSAFKLGIEDTDLPTGFKWIPNSSEPPHYRSTGSYHLLPAFTEKQIETWSFEDFQPFFESKHEKVFRNPLRVRVFLELSQYSKESWKEKFQYHFLPSLRNYFRESNMIWNDRLCRNIWDWFLNSQKYDYKYICLDLVFASYYPEGVGVRFVNDHIAK